MIKYPFNENWLFYKAGYESEMKIVNLPHDAMLFEKRDKASDSGNGCAFFEGGKYVYTKKFTVPEEYQNKFVALEFEGVYKDAKIYVNGRLAAERPYGYSNFYVELEPYLLYGKENEIKVVADNSKQPNSRWYSGSGIYREVYLYVADKTHIAFHGVKIRTLSLHPAKISIEIEAVIEKTIDIKTEILFDNKVVASASGSNQRIIIKDAKLWDEENPNLYDCHVLLSRDGKVIDEQVEKFGIRMLDWSPKGFFVNGKETLMKGACIHHDNGILGACAFRDAEERKVKLLKKAGFNAIRSSHNPVSKAMLEACDKYGLYMMDESFDQWYIHKNKYDYASDFEKWWKEDMASMIHRDFNHPCVIMYSIGNEISETAMEEGIKLAGEMCDFVRSIDTTRPVTTAVSLLLNAMVSMGKGIYQEDKSATEGLDNMSGSAFVNMAMTMYGKVMNIMAASPMADKASKGIMSQMDIAGYNYGRTRYKKDAKHYPERIILGTETLPPDIYDNWQKVKEIPSVIGDFIWTGWDYIGESGIACTQYDCWEKQEKNPPLLLGGAGVIDITGLFRPEVWLNRAVYGYEDKPYIGVEPVIYSDDRAISSPWRKTDALHSWSWHGCEGKKAKILVYSNADEIALYKNNKKVAKKKVKKCTAVFHTTYEPGTLVAIAYKGGEETSRSALKTSGNETNLTVKAEKTKIRANGQDLAYLNIAITDSEGIVKSTDNRKVSIKVEGAGTLQGFGTSDPHTDETFVGMVRTSYYGRAQAVIRAGSEKGEIHVTVTAEGLEPQTVTVITEDCDSTVIAKR